MPQRPPNHQPGISKRQAPCNGIAAWRRRLKMPETRPSDAKTAGAIVKICKESNFSRLLKRVCRLMEQDECDHIGPVPVYRRFEDCPGRGGTAREPRHRLR